MGDDEKYPDGSPAIKRVRELNRRLSGLAGNISPREPGGLSVDYIDSDDLLEIEHGIRETLKGRTLSRAALCKALANIDRKRLYTQAGAESFLRYLELDRIPVHYKTAKEYAKIGGMLIRYAQELGAAGFKEDNGLKKLVYLDKALEHHSGNTAEVFEKVKNCSLRAFQEFARAAEEGTVQAETEQKAAPRSGSAVRFVIADSGIIKKTAASDNQEVIRVDFESLYPDVPEDRRWEFLKRLRDLAEKMSSAAGSEIVD